MSAGTGESGGAPAAFARVKLERIQVGSRDGNAGDGDVPSNARARVLLIESDPGQHGSMRGHLEDAGFELTVVDALDAATSVIEQAMPDVVIVGTSVRDGTPLAAVRGVHESVKSEDVPIVFVLHNEHDDDVAAESALLFGADELLRTPFSPVDLVARVRVLTRLRRELCAMKREQTRLLAEIDELRQQLMHDPLTGLANRQLLDQRLVEEVERARRDAKPLTLVLVSVDQMARVDETHGRAAADRALCSLGVVLTRCVRPVDLVGRFTDTTFLAIAPATPLAGARIFAERLRGYIAASSLKAGVDVANLTVKVTGSLGAVCLEPQPDDSAVSVDALLRRLTAALARATSAGGDRVVFANDP